MRQPARPLPLSVLAGPALLAPDHQDTPSMRKVIKVRPQKWAMPSVRQDTCFGLTSKLFLSSGKFRDLDAHVQQSEAQYLLSWQHPCRCPPWDFHTPSEPTFCTTCFSSTRMLPQDSSWDRWQIPWHLSDEHPPLIDKPLLPDLNMYHQRMEQLLVHSLEELVPLKPIVSKGFHSTSMTSATALPSPPSSQRLQFCSRESQPFPFKQQVGIPTWKSRDFPQAAWAPGRENWILSREDIRETQAPEWTKQRESSTEDAWETEASGRQLPISSGMKDNAETKVPEWKSQRRVISKTDGEILPAGWENWGYLGVENRAKIQELGKRNQREASGELPPETQAHKVENQEESRYKTDAETQAQGSGKQGQTGNEKGEEFQVPWWGKQDQIRGDAGTEIQAEERRNKDQVGGENVVQNQISGRENLGEIKQEDGVEIQAQGWGKQECVESENVPEIQTPGWEKQDQGRSEKARGEIQKQLRHEFQEWWRWQGLKRGKDAGETQISKRKNLREIKGEDWVVIQAVWWEDQKLVASEIDREFEIPCWANQGQIGGEHRTEIQAPKKRDQRKDREEDGINTLAPEAENQEPVRDETHVDTHPADRRNQEQFGDETSTDIQVPEMENLRGVTGEDSKETQKLGEENQGQLGDDVNGKLHTPKWKNEEHIRSKDGANSQASDAQNCGELTSKVDGETHSAERKKEEQAGGENGTEIQAPEKRNQREAGGEDGTETWAPGGENQSQLTDDIDRRTQLLENQEQMGGENGTKIQAAEKRNQRGIGSKDDRKIQRLRGVNQRLLKSKINGETCTSEWKNQEQIGAENGAEIQIQGQRNLRGTIGGDGRETQTQLRSPIDEKFQIQGQENQKKGGDEGATEIWDVGIQRKCRAEDAGEPGVPRREIRDQVSEKDAAEGNLRADCSGDEGLPVLTDSGYEAMEEEQAVASATCPEMQPLPPPGEPFLLSSEEGKHLASQSTTPARKDRVEVSPAAQQAPSSPQRSQQRDNRVDPGTASDLVWQLQNPQSLAASLTLPSSCPSDSCDQAPQAATALVGVPTALTALPKRPVFRKSQQVLLESLIQQRIAHQKWGIPQRILESHSLFNLLDPCSLPLAGVKLPGLDPACELQRQQAKLCETQGSRPGLKSPEKSQKVQPPARKSSKLSTQARALEKCRPQGSEPQGVSIHLPKPRRVRPPGGSRERQADSEEAPPRAKLAAPRHPRPAAGSRNWTGRERVGDPSSEKSRDRKMVRPGVSQTAERVPSSVRTSDYRAGRDLGRKESTSQEASKHRGLKCQQPTHQRRESPEGRGAEQQSSSCSKDTASFKGSLRSAAGSLSITRSDPTLLPKVGDAHVREDSIGGHTSLKRDLQPPGHCCAEAALPKTESLLGQGEPENSHGAPQSPPASQKLGLSEHLRCFLFRCCFSK